MSFEFTSIEARTGSETALEEGVAEAAPLVPRAKRCLGMELRRLVEAPRRNRLVVGWRTVENHTKGSPGSTGSEERRLVGAFFAAPPVVEHTHRVLKAFLRDRCSTRENDP